MSTGRQVNEETPLLSNPQNSRKPTPLPVFQLAIVLTFQACEAITSSSIYPYINQLVRELDITGGDDRKVGYYAGLIESLFFVTQAMTGLHWSRLSDSVGRKPIVLVGLFGASLSVLSFGLSRTFWGLVVSRCLCGLLNGNIGVMKSIIGEITDSSNQAQGFSGMSIVWSAGIALGSIIGGSLCKPSEHFPKLFGHQFWKAYPYFLPALATSSFVLFSFLLTLFFLKETVPRRQRKSHSGNTPPTDGPLPFRKIMVFPVIISSLSYTSIAFFKIAHNALLPLFFTMPIEIGGLGFDPVVIGYIMGAYGIVSGVFQAFYFAKIVRYLGERTTVVAGTAAYIPMFALFPVMSLAARNFGVNAFTWICIAIILFLTIMTSMAFACTFMYINASAPNKHSLGAVNGFAQTTTSIARAVGPGLATSLFSLSVEHLLLGGYAVYAIFTILPCFALILACRLPHKMWEAAD